MCECAPCVCLEPVEVKRGHQTPGTGVINNCELPCGCSEIKLRSNATNALNTEPSLSPSKGIFMLYIANTVFHSFINIVYVY